MPPISELERLWPASFEGRYAPDRILARGGFGIVALARDLRSSRSVAVKLLNPDHHADPVITARFTQEARIVSRLAHPNIVPLLDYGVCGTQAFIVLPYVPGESLRQALRRGPLAPELALSLCSQVASALAAIHSVPVVHRDLKPDNVLLDLHGQALVTDFGISKIGASGIQTAAGIIMGTPGYVAPEIIRELPVTPASDLYALGVLLFEMLVGHRPFARAASAPTLETITPIDEMIACCQIDPAPPSEHGAQVPRSIDTLVTGLLAREPGMRPNAAQALDELTRAAAPASCEETIRIAPRA